MFIHMDTAFIFSSGIPFCEKKNNISSLPLEVSSGRSPSLAKLTAYTRHLTQLNLQFDQVKDCALSPVKAKSAVHVPMVCASQLPRWDAGAMRLQVLLGAHLDQLLSHVCLIATLWTVACQVPVYGISKTRILVWVAIFSSSVEATDKACNSTQVPFVVVFFSFRIIECGFFLCVLFYTGAQLINNVVLVLGLQQSGSFMHIRVSNILKLFSQLGCYRILKRTPSNQK